MALKRQIAKLEEVDEKFRGAYVQKGDVFVLDAEEDPDAGKLSEFRENNRKMKEQLDGYLALGMTPDQAKAKLVEVKKKADDDANEKLTAKQLQEKYEKQLAEQKTADEAEKTELKKKLEQLEVVGPIREKLVTAGLIRTEVEDFLEKPSFRKRFRKGEKGIEFLDEQGDPVLGMTVDKFVEQTRKDYARWFEPLKPGGAGTKAGEAPAQKTDVRKIPSGDQEAINASMDDIASGKAVVVFGDES